MKTCAKKGTGATKTTPRGRETTVGRKSRSQPCWVKFNHGGGAKWYSKENGNPKIPRILPNAEEMRKKNGTAGGRKGHEVGGRKHKKRKKPGRVASK